MADKLNTVDDWMYPQSPAEDRYSTDPEFRMLVDVLTSCIYNNHYTPSELRQAAHLASMKYENMNIQRMYYEIEKDRLTGVNPHRFILKGKDYRACCHCGLSDVYVSHEYKNFSSSVCKKS